jgi:hypothetical protein
LVVAVVALASCGNPPEPKKDVADSSGLFHYKVPAVWQSRSEPGMTTAYAAEDLPGEGETAEALTIVTMLSTVTTDTPVPEALADYIAGLSAARGWTDVQAEDPVAATVGDRAASRIDVSGTDASGRAFQAAYLWIRTNAREVLVVAVAPADRWNAYSADLHDVLNEWYWHLPEGTEAEE